MTAIRVEPLELHQGQRTILETPARFKVAACGRRFGKTMLASWWIAAHDERSAINGKQVAWFAPTYKLLMDVWTQIERTLRPIIRRSNRMEQRIELTTDGTLDFWTLEDIDAGRGRRYHRVVIDEAAHARYLRDAWQRSIRPTLSDFAGEAWFVSTPSGVNYFHELYLHALRDSSGEWAAFQMPTLANPHIKPEEIDAARAQLPELVFSQEYLAHFVTWGGGLVKTDMLIDAKAPSDTPRFIGVDLAISKKEKADYTVIATITRDPKTGVVYIVEVERGRWSFDETMRRIQQAASRHRPAIIGIEDVQYQAAIVQELARKTTLSVRGVRPDRDKVTRFAPLLARFEQRLMRLDPDHVPGYVRDELLAFPDGEHDDIVDAITTAWVAMSSCTQSGTVAMRNSRVFDHVIQETMI